MAKINGTTGALDIAWDVGELVRDAGQGLRGPGHSHHERRLDLRSSAAYFGAGGNLEGTFKIRVVPPTGRLDWIDDCHGDTYALFAPADASIVYTAATRTTAATSAAATRNTPSGSSCTPKPGATPSPARF